MRKILVICAFIINIFYAQNPQNPQNLAQNLGYDARQNPQNLAQNLTQKSQNPRFSHDSQNPQKSQNPRFSHDSQNPQKSQNPSQKSQLPQKPLIVEYEIFQKAQHFCAKNTDERAKMACLINYLRGFNGKIWTKFSGSSGRFVVLFYALNSDASIVYPKNISNRFCEFRDTLGVRHFSQLRGDGVSYILEYPFSASSSHNRAYINCGFISQGAQISMISQPISVIPKSIEISFAFKDASEHILDLRNVSEVALKAQNNPLLIHPNATARTSEGKIDMGFSENFVPLYVRFNRDNGLCSAVGERVSGSAQFRSGRLRGNNISVEFSDVASGELEIALVNKLDAKDRIEGKCVDFGAESNVESNANFVDSAKFVDSANFKDSTNDGKIPCQRPIIIKKRLHLLPHSFRASIDNNGKMLYYNQHTFIPAIAHLPLAKLEFSALNATSAPLQNFTKDCYGRDLSVKLEHNSENFVLINENMADSIIPKETFLEGSNSRVVRKISVRGIKDRDLTPLDLFNSKVLNLNETNFTISFAESSENLPKYMVKPSIKHDWRIALMRGRISILPPTNENEALVANPKIAYQIYCKSPTCRIVDIESVISPSTRLPKASANHWYVNSAHWRDLKVEGENLRFDGENLRIYSLGQVVNGIQTLALQSAKKGRFELKIAQGYGADDFAQFLYFSPTFENMREDLGERLEVEFR